MRTEIYILILLRWTVNILAQSEPTTELDATKGGLTAEGLATAAGLTATATEPRTKLYTSTSALAPNSTTSTVTSTSGTTLAPTIPSEYYSPQTFSLKNEVTSGPVVLVDKKHLYIPNLRYNGEHKNVHFWVGNGTEPDENGMAIPDENGSLNNLQIYTGQNVNLELPSGISIDNIEYFGLWSIDEKLNLGHVILKGIKGVPKSRRPESTSVLRVPKCCPMNFVLTVNGCEENPSFEFNPQFNVYEHNETHFNNNSLDLSLVRFEPYTFSLECSTSGKYPLDDQHEEFALLMNGSLLLKGAAISGILSQVEFCLENLEDEPEKMRILVCAPELKIQYAMYFAYISLTFISTLCFAVTFFLYFFCFKIEDVHRKCFTAYVCAMLLTFVCLTIVQTLAVEEEGCAALGFFFQFFMIASFTLLGILCCDIYIIVTYVDEDKNKRKRKYCYIIVGIVVPVVSLIISLARNLTPDVPNSFFKPQYQKNSCYFEEENQRSIFFYLPVALSILVSAIFLVLTKLKIVKNDEKLKNNYFWIEKGTTYKFMFRQCLLTLAIMTICWISNMLMSFLDESSGIINAAIIFESLQGVLIVFVFTMNHYGSTFLKKKAMKRMINQARIDANSVELQRLNHHPSDR